MRIFSGQPTVTIDGRLDRMRIAGVVAVSCFFSFVCGCAEPESESQQKPPLPVSVTILAKTVSTPSNSATGSVKSWKTEDLGFEVSGRVEWVLEPGENVDGRILDSEDNEIFEGTKLAQIESERYEIAVQSAEADLEVATLNKQEIEIRIIESIPAQIASAEADEALAKADLERAKKLESRNAASTSELEQASNSFKTRSATVLSLKASEKQAQAQLKSAEAQIRRASQTLRDAKRDLNNTTLYGSYRGQVSQVMVVPGSVVSAGSPVLTLQMTNPIKVEVELSARQSRKIRERRSIPATFTLPDGSRRETTAFVYNIDPSADPTTRTFTLTLLMLNELMGDDVPSGVDEKTVARSEDLWPIKLNRMMGTDDGVILAEEKSIRRDENGAYLYVATNAKHDEILPSVFKVRRQTIIENDLLIPFLGTWFFRSVTMVDEEGMPQEVDPALLYVGQLDHGEELQPTWDGESVVLDAGSQWMLRPGDLVQVDMSQESSETGFRLPSSAVFKASEMSSLFVIEDGKAREIQVELVPSENLEEGSDVQVRSPALREGMQVVVEGVHLLRDGQSVRIINRSELKSMTSRVQGMPPTIHAVGHDESSGNVEAE